MGRVRLVGIVMAGVGAAWGPVARGQVGEQVSEIVPLVVDSGAHDNPSLIGNLIPRGAAARARGWGVWWIATHIEDVPPDELRKRAAAHAM